MNQRNWNEYVRQVILERQIHTVRVSLHDNSNVQRARFVSSNHFLDKVINDNIAYPSILFSMDSSTKLVEKAGAGFESGYPSWMLKPDLSTFSVVPYAQGHARVIADVYDNNGKIVDTIPRYILQKVLKKYEEEGIKVKGAFEYEFFVFKKNSDKLEPIWNGLNCLSEIKQSTVEEIISSIMLNLEEIGAGPEVANTEYASGQFEITNSPFWGIEIADMAFYYRTSIREIVDKFGLTATFMAKPVSDQSGSGAHIHLSLYDIDDNNLLYDHKSKDGLSALCHHFIGGQIKHAQSMTALVNSTINSYKRLQPYSFAPTTASWGYEHRGAMIRVPNSRNENTRIENRLPGADTNPYISLAAMLAAGLDGIKNNIEPCNPLLNEDAYKCDREALPSTLQQAINELKIDTFYKETLGAEFLEHYINLREAEINRYNKHISDWEYKEYMEIL